eukprot:TRINITY_DN81301_c0_g1_i1.p1 TRINITY_DN81301_c0_g1~~TRINITY_DN81301_c0_g1_i1.p1  ORF type:complete len:674 (-),score=118.34 TRINITY_DN81301_c0_g1_i1:199-1950(-)
MFMRKIRENELRMIKKLLNELKQTAVESKEDLLNQLLRRLGYFPDHEAIVDACNEAGIVIKSDSRTSPAWKTRGKAPKLPVAINSGRIQAKHTLNLTEAYRFLEVYRKREGFTAHDAEELEVGFKKFAGTTVGADVGEPVLMLDAYEAGRCLQSLGYVAPFEVERHLFSEVNINGSGLVSFAEFLKLVRRYKERELEEIRSSLFKIGFASMGLLSGKVLSRSLNYLGVHKAEELGTDVDAPQHSTVIQRTLRQRAELRATAKQNAGFDVEATQDLRQKFQDYDADGSNTINAAEIRQLCQSLMPELASDAKNRPELIRLLKEVDSSGDGSLDFHDFLILIRKLKDSQKKQKILKEERVVSELGMSAIQVHGFRVIFIQYDTAGKDSLTFAQVRKLLASLICLGDRLVKSLRDVWCKTVEISVQVAEPDEWLADFPDFLKLMQALIEMDFAGIKVRCDKIVSQDQGKDQMKRISSQRTQPSQEASQVERTLSNHSAKSSAESNSVLSSLPMQPSGSRRSSSRRRKTGAAKLSKMGSALFDEVHDTGQEHLDRIQENDEYESMDGESDEDDPEGEGEGEGAIPRV